MHNKVNDLINSQIIEINSIHIFSEENQNQVNIKMSIKASDSCISISFLNVSALEICGLSYPNQIAGFEVVCNEDKGWDKNQRYTINDYEDGKIKFFCEDILLGI